VLGAQNTEWLDDDPGNQAKYTSFLLKNSKIISAHIVVLYGNSFVTQFAKL